MTAFVRSLQAVFVAVLTAAPALADNASYDATSSVCEREVYNCTIAHNVGPTPQSSGFTYYTNALATGYNGGYVLASATFAPATETLGSGEYTSASTAGLTYTFQIAGPADLIVPLHVFARLSVAPIHATDDQGHLVVVDENGALAVASNFRIYGNAGFRLHTDRMAASTRLPTTASTRHYPAVT